MFQFWGRTGQRPSDTVPETGSHGPKQPMQDTSVHTRNVHTAAPALTFWPGATSHNAALGVDEYGAKQHMQPTPTQSVGRHDTLAQ